MKFQILSKAANKVVCVAGKHGRALQKCSPQILLGVGVIGVVGTIIWASYESTKLGETLDECADRMDEVKTPPDEWIDAEDGEFVPDSKEIGKVYLANAWSIMRLYVGPAFLGVASIALIVESHHILNLRYLSSVAAYETVDQAFEEYRGRVREDLGEDADLQYRYGWKEETIEREVEGKNGKKKVVEETVRTLDKDNITGEFARFFDETCMPYWSEDPEKNLLFLKMQQQTANDRLRMQESLLLNEVFDMLGLPRTTEGATCGWIRNKNRKDRVDFGIFDPVTGAPKANWANRRFINGYEPIVLLDFNCHRNAYKEI